MDIRITLNGKSVTAAVPANQTLSDFLRSNGHWSVKHGCDGGECGNCTVILDGRAVYSCLTLAARADGKSVETFEGIRERSEFAPIKEILMDFGDMDCGYCIPGMMMAMKALVDRIPEPSEEEIRDQLAGVICHCVRSVKPIESLMAAVRKMRGKW